MTPKKTIREQIDSIEDYLDLATLSEDIWGRSSVIYDKLKDDSFTGEERYQVRAELLRLAERILTITDTMEV